MALNISFEDYDTVCYSTQYNIIQLIKHSVGISVQVDINTGSIDNIGGQIFGILDDIAGLRDQLQQATTEAGNTANSLNSLVLRVNKLETDLAKLRSEYDLFAYAVTQDLSGLGQRITALENKVG